MVEVNPSDPNQGKGPVGGPAGPKGPVKPKDPTSVMAPGANPNVKNPMGSVNAMKEWLGPKAYKAFQDNFCKQIVSDIGKRRQKEKKIAEQLKRAEEGKDMYDS